MTYYHPITIGEKTYYPYTVIGLTRNGEDIFATLTTTELESGRTDIFGLFVPPRLYGWIKKSFVEGLLLYVNMRKRNTEEGQEIDAVFPCPEPIRNAADDKRARAIFAE